MTKSDYCSDCPWNYEGFANNLILPRASDLNLCEEQDPDNPDCHRHDEWLEIDVADIISSVRDIKDTK